jgi:hypothetical protein
LKSNAFHGRKSFLLFISETVFSGKILMSFMEGVSNLIEQLPITRSRATKTDKNRS